MTQELGSPISLSSYWSGISKSLDAKLVSLKEYLSHPGSGFAAEEYFRIILRDHLPSRFSVDTGFVVSSHGRRSNFIDIIIADTYAIPRLCKEATYSIFPIEAVCAVIEVTTSPKQTLKKGKRALSKFQSDITKLAVVREMGHKRYYLRQNHNKRQVPIEKCILDLCPRAFLITCGDEWRKSDTYAKHLLNGLKESKRNGVEPWINAVFSVEHGCLIFKPYTQFKYKDWISKNSLMEFILFLNYTVTSYQTPHVMLDVDEYRKMPEIEPAMPVNQDTSNNK